MAATKEEMESLKTDVFTLGIRVGSALKDIQAGQQEFKDYVAVTFAQHKLVVEEMVQLAKREFEVQRNGIQGVVRQTTAAATTTVGEYRLLHQHKKSVLQCTGERRRARVCAVTS